MIVIKHMQLSKKIASAQADSIFKEPSLIVSRLHNLRIHRMNS